MNLSTFVISLDNPTTLLEKLHKHELNPILFKGINGKTVEQDLINTHFTQFYSKFGPKSSIGCALSHLYVWKQFLESDSNYALIFEDDIVFDESINLKQTINEFITQTPKDFDILALGSFGSENTNNFFYLVMNLLQITSDEVIVNEFIKKPHTCLAAHAYILSRKGASKLIENLNNNIHNHIDFCIQQLESQKKIIRYITTPRLIFQTSTDNTMSNNVSSSHPILFNRLLSNYYLDTKVKASYVSTLSILRIGNHNLNSSTIILILLCFLAIYLRIHILYILIFIISISLPEIMSI